MMQRSNVVPKVCPLTEEDFRETWLLTLGRLCKAHGDPQVALWLGIGIEHLRKNVKSGSSLPTADKIWNLLAYDNSAHDELDAEYGLKNVHSDAICTADPLTRDLIALAHETAEHEADESAGGIATTDHELIEKDEIRLRKVYRVIGTWLHRLEEIRRPRSVA